MTASWCLRAFSESIGNAVVIDHGCGIQSLYGHMSSIAVKEGDAVKSEQEIGRTGQTGLAGGDHLHFTMLLDGIPVNPVEWWDPHWIHDRIEAKLQPTRSRLQVTGDRFPVTCNLPPRDAAQIELEKLGGIR